MVFNSKPLHISSVRLKGITKVYYKNLNNVLSCLDSTNMFLNTHQFVNFLTQAEDLLTKLKKSDEQGNYTDMENELNAHKEQFMKWQASLTA
ncbi:MAG: hypothetical protein J0L69_16710 [Bacteroidetes bacterium]|nr:hypothetical protein [Bacteroidota bacterium]